ncbi:MAG: excinuclease ABC subunit UvrA [Deltaproteobacteria bacterium]|nr:excinuclease ABC subunit UvrA [Deltaproteobacteria bacterium]MCK5682248.1 excinuclease ABC subunit UvrA [bacterium]
MEEIVIKGAREHNLKDISLVIPRRRFVVITGLSGSGKSSLAFDTIYAEGQRRYVESLSAYARQFLQLMEKPDVDEISGLSPAISIEQKKVSHNPRSTVGTVTEIYDYLRLLYARVGVAHCVQCGKPITSQTVDQIADVVEKMPVGTKLMIMAPLVRRRKGEYRKLFSDLQSQGFLRIEVDGEVYRLDSPPLLDRQSYHDILLVVDRLVVNLEGRGRLVDSLELALDKADDLVAVQVVNGERLLYSRRLACSDCGISVAEVSPRLFSFNNPHGACLECGGLGRDQVFDVDLIVPDPSLSLAEGALAPWRKSLSFYRSEVLEPLSRHYGFSLTVSFAKLSKKVKKIVMFGSGREKIPDLLSDGRYHKASERKFEGVIPGLKRRYEKAEGENDSELLRYLSPEPCSLCHGSRLNQESLQVKVAGLNIYELTSYSLPLTMEFLTNLVLPPAQQEIARRILSELVVRLQFLIDVGLDYLTLARASATLSGGESQRIRLATQIGSGLTGVLYVLDEPSIGLHQRDNRRLLKALLKLRDLGNSLLVVEHDQETIMAADQVIDMGPGAGRLGGEVVAQGTPEEIAAGDSLTGLYLSGRKKIEIPERRPVDWQRCVTLKGVSQHNLKSIDVDFPLGLLVCVTGVSGSGKSSLINETLYPALHNHLYSDRYPVGSFQEIRGLDQLDKAINIDQSPIGRTPRSNPATYTGVFTPIRELFAGLPEARIRGYKPGRFSFNVKGGRCEACKGDGFTRVEMHFLPDIFVKCDSCGGRRFTREVLEVRYKGSNIAEVLAMTINQAAEFFAAIPRVIGKLEVLKDVGLGYMTLGQAAVTLSGGEAQRVKLARELAKRATGRTLFLLDEPTTGLHFHDVKQLLKVLQRLVGEGNSVIIIEHNLDIIKAADYLIDLGPDGGVGGGRLVACGPPEAVAKVKESATGQCLREVLQG